MSFWIVMAQEYLPGDRHDPMRRQWRANTLAEVLADRGHDVTRWRSGFCHYTKTYLAQGDLRVPFDNYHMQYLGGPAYRRHVGLGRVRHHRALGQGFARVAAGLPVPRAIHVAGAPIALARAAVAYGAAHGVPVVVDVRDLWPDVYADLLPAALRPAGVWALHRGAFGLRATLGGATGITTLTPSYLDWALGHAGRGRRAADGIFPMGYPPAPPAPEASALDRMRDRLGLALDDVVACYLGNIGGQSDFDTAIAAARHLAQTHPRFKMVIAGRGPRLEALRTATRDLPNVILPGWIEGGEMQALLALSSIGLVIFNPVENYLRNIPNKYPEYLSSGLAILCGLEGEMGALTRSAGCGRVYASGDARAMAATLAGMLDAPGDLAQMGQVGRDVHRDRFDGARIYGALADHLETLAEGGLRDG